MNRPSILCVLMGGTIAMDVPPKGSMQASISDDSADRLRRLVKRSGLGRASSKHQLARVTETVMLINEDSTDLQVDIWEQLVELIENRYREFDGFLICMGTNTLAYVSSALSFALRRISKPVVITGSQIPMGKPWTDGHSNLINSQRWLWVACTKGYAGVYVVFGSQIIRGSRAKKFTESGMEAFGSFNDKYPIGELGAGITLFEQLEEKDPNKPFKAENGFDSRIVCITLIPGLSSSVLKRMVGPKKVRGVILRSFGSGDIPRYLYPFLDFAAGAAIPIVNTTQCPNGKTLMGINEMGRESLARGVIPAFDMSMEAMSTKLMWLLNKDLTLDEVRRDMTANCVGEINTRLVNATKHYLETGVQTIGKGTVVPD